jgi:Golgi phosphoprotein 3
MLMFADALYLLSLDEKKGGFDWVEHRRFDQALAGAILMELALANRIDADLKRLMLVDASPVGDDLHDRVLGMFGGKSEDLDASWWVEEVAFRMGDLKDILLARLKAAGVLQKSVGKGLLVFRKVRWQIPADRDDREVLLHQIRAAVLNDDIPDPRDIILVCLVHACNLLGRIFSLGEIRDAEERIDLLSRMDLIGQAVYQNILSEIRIPIAY